MSPKPRVSNAQGGYILLGIVILLVIMGIFLGAAVPLWQHVMKREREAELIWRGNQYIRAIELYQRKYPGAYPVKLEDLVEQKFLRKLYKDPMTEDGEWKVLRQLSPEARSLFQPAGGSTRQRPRRPGQPGDEGDETQSPFQARGPTGSRFGGQEGEGLGGIVGVVSKSTEESIRILDGKERYSEWLFVYGTRAQTPRAPGTPPPGASPPPPGTQGGPGLQPPRTRQPQSPFRQP